MKRLVIILVLISVVFYCQAQQYSKKWTNLNYADDGKNYHALDIYLPPVVKTNYPVIVYIYGSAWFSDNLKGSDLGTVGNALLNAGYAVVMPNHRSSSDSLFPAQINDIKAVVRYVRANCQLYSLDTTFIGISGSSSGGHLAALSGTSNSVKEFTYDSITFDIEGKVGKNLKYSSKVNAVCDWFGPTDLLRMDSCRGSMAYAEGQSPEEVLIGCSKKKCNSKFVFASPLTYIDPTDPPFLIFHGDADNVVPYCESELLNSALNSAGVQSELIITPKGQHYTGVHISANFKKMVDFFNKASNNNLSSITIQEGNDFQFTVKQLNKQLIIGGANTQKIKRYEILDQLGKLVIKHAYNHSAIDLSGLAGGIYFIKLDTGNSSETQKILISY